VSSRRLHFGIHLTPFEGYRRTVLVVWPLAHNAEVEYDDDPSEAFNVINITDSSKPNREERQMVKYLLRGVASGKLSSQEVAQCVCQAACTWNDLTLWLRAVKLCGAEGNIDVLGAEGLSNAIRLLGFESVRPM
jgi:hypothetical protein